MADPELLSVLRRWWWALLLGTVLATIAGFVAASSAAKSYEAQVSLLVGPVNSSTGLDTAGGLARTYAELAKTEPVLRTALVAAGDPRDVDKIRDDVSTSSNSITRIVSVTVRDRDPGVAARLANNIGLRLEALANTSPPIPSGELDDLSHQPELARLSRAQQDSVLRAATRVFGASQAGRLGVVQAASPALRPAGPDVPARTILAALAGCCIAAVLAFLLELRARSRPAKLAPVEETEHAAVEAS